MQENDIVSEAWDSFLCLMKGTWWRCYTFKYGCCMCCKLHHLHHSFTVDPVNEESVHFPAWQPNTCSKKKEEKNGRLESEPVQRCLKAPGSWLLRGERTGSRYSSYIYLWALLKSKYPNGPQEPWMRPFWKLTEWAIHKLLPCINMGHIWIPIWKP